jgi:hypothetical protein
MYHNHTFKALKYEIDTSCWFGVGLLYIEDKYGNALVTHTTSQVVQ